MVNIHSCLQLKQQSECLYGKSYSNEENQKSDTLLSPDHVVHCVSQLRFAEDGNSLATGGADCTVKLWGIKEVGDEVDLILLQQFGKDYLPNLKAVDIENPHAFGGGTQS